MKLVYELTFFLNAEHYVVDVSGAAGEVHPHSWEVKVRFAAEGDSDRYEQFTEMEKMVKNYLAIYEGNLLNEDPPFNVLVPTLENIAKVFSAHLRNVMEMNGFVFEEISVAESPSRRVVMSDVGASKQMRPAPERKAEATRQVPAREQERDGKVVRLPLLSLLKKGDRAFF